MGELIAGLVPLAFGILLSPLAYMALVAVLLSRLARVNGIAFLLGWGIGVVGVLAVSIWLFGAFDAHPLGESPLWMTVVRLVLGAFLVAAAVWVYRRGAKHLKAMAVANSPREVAAAAPQLPGWLQAVDRFNPFRAALLGLGIFVLNPVDATCAIIAGLDFVLTDLPDAETIAIATGFTVLGVLPIAIPVVLILLQGAKAQPFLNRTRGWIATHTGVLNAALLLVIGVLQLQKGISGLF
ncbi:GAP family protein [Agromyces laixinhei]|uniref:GAP family protein n=1 Tax=Agromyces laixinhei TaxID=2585717 RepID=UPI0012ED3B87|nr:GAP family protein [Agromyces laixinhei]